MDVRNCKGCNRLFQHIGGPVLCPVCREELENKFAKVKEYIYENRGASISEVSEAMEVPVKQIKQWIKEERLVLSDATEAGIVCEQCGVPIRSGRFCEKCKSQMVNNLSATISKPKAAAPAGGDKKGDKHSNKMRFLS